MKRDLQKTHVAERATYKTIDQGEDDGEALPAQAFHPRHRQSAIVEQTTHALAREEAQVRSIEDAIVDELARSGRNAIRGARRRTS